MMVSVDFGDDLWLKMVKVPDAGQWHSHCGMGGQVMVSVDTSKRIIIVIN